MQWYRCISKGKVQGVYYRKFVADAMRRAGFKGFIRNLPDGTVETEVFIYDEDEETEKVKEILQQGSPLSEVEAVECAPSTRTEHPSEGFVIRY